MSQECGSCEFYQVNPGAVNQGVCRRYPPTGAVIPRQTAMGTEIKQIAFCPPVQGAQWCGEYQRKPQPEDN